MIDRKARAGPLAVAARRQERILLANQRRLQKQVAIAQVASSMYNFKINYCIISKNTSKFIYFAFYFKNKLN